MRTVRRGPEFLPRRHHEHSSSLPLLHLLFSGHFRPIRQVVVVAIRLIEQLDLVISENLMQQALGLWRKSAVVPANGSFAGSVLQGLDLAANILFLLLRLHVMVVNKSRNPVRQILSVTRYRNHLMTSKIP